MLLACLLTCLLACCVLLFFTSSREVIEFFFSQKGGDRRLSPGAEAEKRVCKCNKLCTRSPGFGGSSQKTELVYELSHSEREDLVCR